MDGLQATAAIRALEAERGFAPVHIIALSASMSTEDKEQAYRAGVNDYSEHMLASTPGSGFLLSWALRRGGCEGERLTNLVSSPAKPAPAVPKPIYPEVVRLALQKMAAEGVDAEAAAAAAAEEAAPAPTGRDAPVSSSRRPRRQASALSTLPSEDPEEGEEEG